MRLTGLTPVFLLALLSCGPVRAAYTDLVQDSPPTSASPRFLELTKVVDHKPFAEVTRLVQTWKQWLGSQGGPPLASVPLVEGTKVTFVYYDVADQLDRVWLEASFCEGRPVELVRWEQTRLFYRVFVVPQPSELRYRFVASPTNPEGTSLADPFHADVASGSPAWSVVPSTLARVQYIDASLEPGLEGQDLRVLLPPGYDRDLSRTWPTLVLVGRGGSTWEEPFVQAFASAETTPVVIALVPRPGVPLTAAGLVSQWATQVQPWLATRYRLAGGPPSTVLVGWSDAVRPALEAAAHLELFGRVWTPAAGTPANDTAWKQSVASILATSFVKVNP